MTSSGPTGTEDTTRKEELLRRLRDLYPEAFDDDEVDWPTLRSILEQEAELNSEPYELTWPGKRKSAKEADEPPNTQLEARPDESVRFEETENLFFEGDNLEALKHLQSDHLGKVDIIYIDPPYNTGETRSYQDDYSTPVREYLENTGQTDLAGVDGGKKAARRGRRHSAWLSMMYPRLALARRLLRDDGVIFVSIDDNELHNLRIVMDELFGPENYVETFSWVRTRTPANLSRKTKKVLEYILCYQREKDSSAFSGIEKPVQSSNPLLNQTNRVSELTLPAGTPTGIDDGHLEPGEYGTDRYSVELLAPVTVADGEFLGEVRLRGRFRWSQSYLEEQLREGTRVRVPTARLVPAYERDSYGPETPPNLIDESVGVDTNEQATLHLESLLGGSFVDYPKPVSLLRYLLGFRSDREALVLDFFAGSCSTAEAVLRMNHEDGGSRRFIMVELPEPTQAGSDARKAGFETIADVGKERIRKVIDELAGGGSEQLSMPNLTDEDLGFRVYRLVDQRDT